MKAASQNATAVAISSDDDVLALALIAAGITVMARVDPEVAEVLAGVLESVPGRCT